MIPLQNDVISLALMPTTVSTGTATSKTVDMLGFNNLEVAIYASSSTTSAVPTVISLQHADTDAATSYAAIVTAGTASTGFPTQVTAQTHTTSTGAFARAAFNWQGKKRYFRAVITGPASDTATVAMVCVKSRASQSPTGTAAAGFSGAYTFTPQ